MNNKRYLEARIGRTAHTIGIPYATRLVFISGVIIALILSSAPVVVVADDCDVAVSAAEEITLIAGCTTIWPITFTSDCTVSITVTPEQQADFTITSDCDTITCEQSKIVNISIHPSIAMQPGAYTIIVYYDYTETSTSKTKTATITATGTRGTLPVVEEPEQDNTDNSQQNDSIPQIPDIIPTQDIAMVQSAIALLLGLMVSAVVMLLIFIIVLLRSRKRQQ